MLASLGVISLASYAVTALVAPIAVLAAHNLRGIGEIMAGLSMLLQGGAAGAVAGWITPKTAVKAALVLAAFKILSSLASLWSFYQVPSTGPHVNYDVALYVYRSVFMPVCCIAATAVARRLRMKKIAAI